MDKDEFIRARAFAYQKAREVSELQELEQTTEVLQANLDHEIELWDEFFPEIDFDDVVIVEAGSYCYVGLQWDDVLFVSSNGHHSFSIATRCRCGAWNSDDLAYIYKGEDIDEYLVDGWGRQHHYECPVDLAERETAEQVSKDVAFIRVTCTPEERQLLDAFYAVFNSIPY